MGRGLVIRPGGGLRRWLVVKCLAGKGKESGADHWGSLKKHPAILMLRRIRVGFTGQLVWAIGELQVPHAGEQQRTDPVLVWPSQCTSRHICVYIVEP